MNLIEGYSLLCYRSITSANDDNDIFILLLLLLKLAERKEERKNKRLIYTATAAIVLNQQSCRVCGFRRLRVVTRRIRSQYLVFLFSFGCNIMICHLKVSFTLSLSLYLRRKWMVYNQHEPFLGSLDGISFCTWLRYTSILFYYKTNKQGNTTK